MIFKSDIKLIRSLALKKYRQRYKKFIVEGEKSVLEALKFKKESINKIYGTDDFFKNIPAEICDLDHLKKIISLSELGQISNLKNNSSCLAVLEIFDNSSFDALNNSEIVLYLDGVSDPGNIGTIIRTGDWFGIDALICSPECVDFYNPKVVQATMGSMFKMSLYVLEFKDFMKLTDDKFKNIFVTALTGSGIFEVEFKKPLVLVLGNESNGVSDELIEMSTQLVRIPGAGDQTDSLNVAVATGIALSEIFRSTKRE